MFKKIRQLLSNNQGFTLTELLVVIAIIGLLAGITTVSLNSAQKQGRDSKRKADLELLAGALEIYYAQEREYPIAYPTEVDVDSALADTLVPQYISEIPEDPKDSETNPYLYKTNDIGSKFFVEVKLERNEEPTIEGQVDSETYKTGVYEANGSSYYRVASP